MIKTCNFEFEQDIKWIHWNPYSVSYLRTVCINGANHDPQSSTGLKQVLEFAEHTFWINTVDKVLIRAWMSSQHSKQAYGQHQATIRLGAPNTLFSSQRTKWCVWMVQVDCGWEDDRSWCWVINEWLHYQGWWRAVMQVRIWQLHVNINTGYFFLRCVVFVFGLVASLALLLSVGSWY